MSTTVRSLDPGVEAATESTDSAAVLRARQARQRRFGLLFMLVWLLWLIWPIVDVVTSDSPPVVVAGAIALTLVFAGLYAVGAASGAFGAACWLPRIVTIALVVIPLGLAPMIGSDSAAYFIFTGCLTVFVWPVRVSLPVIGALTAWSALLPWILGDNDQGWLFAVLIAGISLLMYATRRMQAQGGEIAQAHERLAELAVADERSRFARDLHDILGHSLTAITVKAELAGKLVDRDVSRARTEIADIERLAREGLEDVRRTAAGYRDVTLVAELAAAHSALAAAGIRAELPQAVDHVPGRLRELFGWAVREGVTNVIRHSGATRCQIRLTPNSVEVIDDGTAGAGDVGSGLRGLADRAAASGAVVQARPASGGGFTLCVRLPSDQADAGAPSNAATPVSRDTEPVT